MEIEQYTSDDLLSKLDKVDAVLDGHTHLIYNTTTKDKNKKDIHISQTGTKLESIGKLIIKSNGTIFSEIIKTVPEPDDKANAKKIPHGNNEVWVDTDMNDFINNIWDEYKEKLSLQYGYLDFDLIIRPEGTSDSHFIYCRYQECTLGNLISDSIREVSNTEIAIVNGGAVRNSLNKGNINYGKIVETLPCYNNVVVKRLPGQCILDALEFGVSKYPKAAGAFPQVSGLTFDFDTNINSSVLTDSQGLFMNITGKRKVSNVKINGEELVLDKLYNVSLLEFMANGGDGYNMFNDYEIFNETLMSDTDSLAFYIKNNLNGTIPNKYKDLQGRINIFNSSEIQSSTVPSSNSGSSTDESINDFRVDKKISSSGGLSTGTIIAIIIPLVILLTTIFIITMILSRRNDGKNIIEKIKSDSNIRIQNSNSNIQ